MILNTTLGFTKIPFGKPDKPDSILKSESLSYLEKRFQDFLKTRGIFLFTGDSGCGKSTSLDFLLNNLNPHKYKSVYLTSYPTSPRGFLRMLVKQLDYQPGFSKEDLLFQISQILSELYSKFKLRPVFVFDEAQNISDAILEEIRLLTNLDNAISPAMVFIAHSNLKLKLKLTCYEPLRQRLSLIMNLAPLSKQEVRPYIEFHLAQAGVTRNLYSDEAIALIFNSSKGLPRLINQICRESLYRIAMENLDLVDESVIEKVIMQLGF